LAQDPLAIYYDTNPIKQTTTGKLAVKWKSTCWKKG